MSLDRRLRRVEKTIKDAKLDQPLLPIVEILINNRAQVGLVETLPESFDLLWPAELEEKKFLDFHEYVQCIPKQFLRAEDRHTWNEQCELSRRLCAEREEQRRREEVFVGTDTVSRPEV